MKIKSILIILFLFFIEANAKHIYKEEYYQNLWCRKNFGHKEIKLIDGTRVDCITKTHAIEFDFAPKWAEAIGQSLHYSRMTGKKAGIVLIIENNSDFKYYKRIEPLCEKYEISLWYMKQPTETRQETQFYKINIIEIIISFLKELANILLAYF